MSCAVGLVQGNWTTNDVRSVDKTSLEPFGCIFKTVDPPTVLFRTPSVPTALLRANQVLRKWSLFYARFIVVLNFYIQQQQHTLNTPTVTVGRSQQGGPNLVTYKPYVLGLAGLGHTAYVLWTTMTPTLSWHGHCLL